MVLEGNNTTEDIKLHKKDNFLMSRLAKVNLCGSKGCSSQNLSNEQKHMLKRCSYEGKLNSDPDSKVNVACDEDGKIDITIVSDSDNVSLSLITGKVTKLSFFRTNWNTEITDMTQRRRKFKCLK